MAEKKRPDSVWVWFVIVLSLLIVLGITDFWGFNLSPGLKSASKDAQSIIRNIWLGVVVILLYLESQLGWVGNGRN